MMTSYIEAVLSDDVIHRGRAPGSDDVIHRGRTPGSDDVIHRGRAPALMTSYIEAVLSAPVTSYPGRGGDAVLLLNPWNSRAGF